MTRGKFIVLEGSEGVGKTTQLEKVSTYLRAEGKIVINPREPGGTPAGELIRTILKDPTSTWITPARNLLLFNACRALLVGTIIEPALTQGTWVVVDRYYPSTEAYQGGGELYSPRKSLTRQIKESIETTIPDLTYILDAPVEVSLARKKHEESTDRFQQKGKEFFDRVRQTYLWYAHDRFNYKERKILIDTEGKNIEEVFTIIKQGLDELLNKP